MQEEALAHFVTPSVPFSMLQALINIFRIPDLRNRVFFTLSMLMIYRVGFWIPLPGVDQAKLEDFAKKASEGAGGFGRFMEYASIFTGGDFGRSTIFGLGIMPYITAAIIFQLLQNAVPRLQELKKEGATGQQKITEWTRYATVGLCFVQSMMWLKYMGAQGMVQQVFTVGTNNQLLFTFAGITALTAGSMFLMWLGEQIDKYGIGNGVSLILTAGIISRMPNAVVWIAKNFDPSQQQESTLGVLGLLFLVAAFVFVVAVAILITVAQRRIPIQQAKHTRGRRVYGGQRHYLPLRVNHAGVMPIIFASSLMIFPSAIFGWMNTRAAFIPAESFWSWWVNVTLFLSNNIQPGQYPYVVCEIVLIYFFSYFWTTVVFSPEEMAKQLRDHGSFIPGLRPGPRTAEYLETVMERVTYVGAGFLAIIAVIPAIVAQQMQIPFFVASFLGGTGLLIVVSVGLDLIQRIEANLVMRNYSGFLSAGDQGRGQRIRGPRG